MIKHLVDGNNIQMVVRPQGGEEFYTFTEITNLLNEGNQAPVNAATSIMKDTKTFIPNKKKFIDEHFNKETPLLSYINMELSDDKLLNCRFFSYNLRMFKKNPAFRNKVLAQIMDLEKKEFKNNIYIGYLYIVMTLLFVIENNMFKSRQKLDKNIIVKYFKDENELLDKYFKKLQQECEIDNLTSLCYGRFYFMDFRLQQDNDYRGISRLFIECLKQEESTLIKKYPTSVK